MEPALRRKASEFVWAFLDEGNDTLVWLRFSFKRLGQFSVVFTLTLEVHILLDVWRPIPMVRETFEASVNQLASGVHDQQAVTRFNFAMGETGSKTDWIRFNPIPNSEFRIVSHP